jgi:DNA-directed RNA polymerase specialized sigma24 family protein
VTCVTSGTPGESLRVMTALLEPQPPLVADSVLLNRLALRDSTALVELERRHRASLYAMAYGMLMDAVSAERVVRDAFAQLWFEAVRLIPKESPRNILRDIARELARAERALRETSTRRR